MIYHCDKLAKSFPEMAEKDTFSFMREKAGLSVHDVAEMTGVSPRTVYRWESGEIAPRKPVFDLLKKPQATPFRASKRASGFTFIDLFAGIGGMRKGFESVGGQCIFTSEWNRFSRQTYAANFEVDHEIAGDITKIEAADIPAHDLLVAGFPCQPFSIAGISKKNSLGRPHGFECNTQGTLFFDVARIIAHHRPAAFVLENVKNLESHDKGNTFRIIKESLLELGYHLQWRVIDAKSFVPQHRERIFIVGFREKTDFNFAALQIPDAKTAPKLGSILHPENGSEEAESPYTKGKLAAVAEKYTLSDKLWAYLQAYAEKHRLKGNGFGFGLFGKNQVARTLSARYHKDGSEILIQQKDQNPRRLTPRECARLMGFDLPGEPCFEIPVSDTQAWRQFGNAVVVPVVAAIAAEMRPFILESISEKTTRPATVFQMPEMRIQAR